MAINIDPDSPTLKSYVKAWMREHTSEYVDPCGEVDMTRLAEQAADEFDMAGDDFQATIPAWFFDMAVDVAIMREEYA
jgi:hypothetical protein